MITVPSDPAASSTAQARQEGVTMHPRSQSRWILLVALTAIALYLCWIV